MYAPFSAATACIACGGEPGSTNSSFACPSALVLYHPTEIIPSDARFYCSGSGSVQTVCGTRGCVSGCYDATKAIDGSVSTFWNAAGASQPTSFELSYPAFVRPQGLSICFKGDGEHDRQRFIIRASNTSGSMYRDVVVLESQLGIAGCQFLSFQNSIAAKYWDVHNSIAAKYWVIEFETAQSQLILIEVWMFGSCKSGYYSGTYVDGNPLVEVNLKLSHLISTSKQSFSNVNRRGWCVTRVRESN
jgi:hypothetical protein